MSSTSDFIIENGVLKKYVGNATNVIVPDSSTKIEASAFWGCGEVKTIRLPDSIESIDSNAFYLCSKLKTINLPEKVERLENETFWGCKKLQDIVLPAKLKYIGFQAFHQCVSLKNVVIPEPVELVDKEAFRKCSKLETITILGTPKLEKDCLRQSNAALITCKLPVSKISGLALKHQAVLGWIKCVNMPVVIATEVDASLKKYMSTIFDAVVEDIVADRMLLPQLISRKALSIDQIDALLTRLAGDPESVSMLLAYKNGTYSAEEVVENEDKKVEKMLRKPTAAEIKKLWAIKEETDGTITLVTYKGAERDILVPSRIGKKPVTKIGYECFADTLYYGESGRNIPNRDERLLIETIEIPEGITSIERNAFYKCISLTTIKIPQSVSYIYKTEAYGGVWRPGETTSPFCGCPNLTIHAPAGSYTETYAKENNIPFVAE